MSAVTHRTPPPWPSDRMPSRAEWVDWFLANTRKGQEEIASQAIGAFEDINRCLMSRNCWINR